MSYAVCIFFVLTPPIRDPRAVASHIKAIISCLRHLSDAETMTIRQQPPSSSHQQSSQGQYASYPSYATGYYSYVPTVAAPHPGNASHAPSVPAASGPPRPSTPTNASRQPLTAVHNSPSRKRGPGSSEHDPQKQPRVGHEHTHPDVRRPPDLDPPPAVGPFLVSAPPPAYPVASTAAPSTASSVSTVSDLSSLSQIGQSQNQREQRSRNPSTALNTDVWYFMRPLDTNKEPAIKPADPAPSRSRPPKTVPYVGCRLW